MQDEQQPEVTETTARPQPAPQPQQQKPQQQPKKQGGQQQNQRHEHHDGDKQRAQIVADIAEIKKAVAAIAAKLAVHDDLLTNLSRTVTDTEAAEATHHAALLAEVRRGQADVQQALTYTQQALKMAAVRPAADSGKPSVGWWIGFMVFLTVIGLAVVW